MNRADYDFRPATAADLPLVSAWVRTPHVQAWWDGSTAYDAGDLNDPRLTLWIVAFGERPFAFAQDYDVHGWSTHHFAYLPGGSRGIDQFIGEADMLGHGHGPTFIRRQVERLFGEGAPVVGTDPHPANGRALRAYEKVGFRVTGGPVETQWGLSMLMECRAEWS